MYDIITNIDSITNKRSVNLTVYFRIFSIMFRVCLENNEKVLKCDKKDKIDYIFYL